MIYVSASQIDTFRQCPRKWAWQYIEHVPREEARAFALGSRVHEILEEYYISGKAPDTKEIWSWKKERKLFYPGAVALTMIKIPFDPRSEVELGFEEEVDGVTYVGKIDLNWVTAGVLEILDHKTSSDPVKWGKTEEALEHDTQKIVYSAIGLIKIHPELMGVNFCLNYGCVDAKPQKSKLVCAAYATREEAIDLFYTEIHPIAKKMTELKLEKKNPMELPYNTHACETFGGCQHKARCNLTAGERVKGIIMGNILMDQLIAKSKVPVTETETEELPAVGPPDKPITRGKLQVNKVSTSKPKLGAKTPPVVVKCPESAYDEFKAKQGKESTTTNAPGTTNVVNVVPGYDRPAKEINYSKVSAGIGYLAGLAVAGNKDITDEINKVKNDILDELGN